MIKPTKLLTVGTGGLIVKGKPEALWGHISSQPPSCEVIVLYFMPPLLFFLKTYNCFQLFIWITIQHTECLILTTVQKRFSWVELDWQFGGSSAKLHCILSFKVKSTVAPYHVRYLSSLGISLILRNLVCCDFCCVIYIKSSGTVTFTHSTHWFTTELCEMKRSGRVLDHVCNTSY